MGSAAGLLVEKLCHVMAKIAHKLPELKFEVVDSLYTREGSEAESL